VRALFLLSGGYLLLTSHMGEREREGERKGKFSGIAFLRALIPLQGHYPLTLSKSNYLQKMSSLNIITV
jgi:hypothetical protein